MPKDTTRLKAFNDRLLRLHTRGLKGREVPPELIQRVTETPAEGVAVELRRNALGVPQLPSNAEGVAVHPALEWSNIGAFWTIDSSKAIPSHPELTRLGLLPSGPDPIHDAPPWRDLGLNIDRTSADPMSSHPQAGIQLRMKRISDRGHP